MIEAGVLGLRISPIATGFWKETDAKLKAGKAPDANVKINADIRKASSEMAMFRMREQANAINLNLKIDEKSIRTANDKIKYIEHTWKQSDIKRAIRVQVYTVGASALPALTQGLMSVTAAMTELSRVSLGLPGLLAGVGSAAATLFTGLKGVGAAFKASSDGMKNSAQNARDYARASRDLENAQRDVVKALKEANREIEDQKTSLARGQLSVEQAQLNVRRANEQMFKGGFQSITEYQQALLDVKSANLDLSDAVRQNSRDISDFYETAGRGAAGSDSFKNSLDNLANSVDNFRKAQFEAAGMSEQFISAMDRLAPAGQDFVLQVLKMRGAWEGLQNSIQTTLFKGLGDSITNLANRQLPVLKTGMQQVAVGLNKDFKAIFLALGRDANTNNIAKIFKNTGSALSAATPGLDSFTNGLLKLSEVGSRFLPRVALAFNKVLARFEAFIDRAEKDGSLERWIDSGLKLVTSLGRSLLSIGSILNSVTEAYNKATGNVGGFASTMERGLERFAKRLASPQGQGMLIKWMRTSREFMAVISEALPGIQKIFTALGDGAREFAQRAFPIFAFIGDMIGGSNGALKTFVTLALTWRTVVPIISSGTKAFNLLNASMQKYVEKRATLLSTKNAAWKAAFDADGAKFAAQTRLRALRDEAVESDRLYTRMFNSRAAGELTLAKATKARQDAEKITKSSKRAAGKDGLSEDVAKQKRGVYLANAKAFKQAKEIEKQALEDFNIRDERLYKAAADRSRLRRDMEVNSGRAYRDLRLSTDLATKAQQNFNKVNRLTADGMSGKWARSVALMKGKYDGLKNAMGFIGGVGASAGLAVGVAVAFDQLTAAQDRNKTSADNLKESQEALATTLSKGTGSATAATLEENARQLRDRTNPVHPDDKGQNFDAAKILEGQLGISLAEAANLTLPTEVKRRESRLAAADAQIIAAVPGLDEWKKWNKDYQANGVDASTYGKALNGDPASIGKVEAAREAIRYANTPGLPLGAAVAARTAPNDLGAAQEQLDRSGQFGGLRGLSLATGAARSIGNESLAKSQETRESANVIPQKGLNSRGSTTFGKFTLGPNGAVINPDGSAVVEVESYPGEAWIQAQAENGISVERRFPNGAVITIDEQFGRQYFNGYARGGSVWGAGSATSDSIPAMLSNGEFVINAKSASLIGHDKLQAMNSMKFADGGLVRRYAPGGPVLPLNPPPDGGSADAVDAILGGNNGPASIDPFNPGGVYGNVPTPSTVSPPIRTDAVNSAPVVRPYAPPPPAISQFGSIANGIDYIPKLGGSGSLPDYGTTGLSGVKKAPINPDANILDYLVQVSNAYGLKPGSGPPDTELGNQVATELGIWNHGPMDGAQHDVHRALDMGTADQSQAGKITDFVKSWMADPGKVAATRQLIYRDPTTGESFGIINGVALFGDELQKVYGADFPGHTKHVHLALEGVPLSAFKPNLPTASIPKLADVPKSPAVTSSPSLPAGPAAAVPQADVDASAPGTLMGPFGKIPFDPISILKQIGAAILNGIFSFFGVDGSGFVNALFGLGGDGTGIIPGGVEEIPEADPELVAGLDAQIAQFEALGTPAGLEMAEKIKAGRDDYLKQFDSDNAAASAEKAAAYFDSIGQPETASRLRAGIEALGPNPNEPNPERFGPVITTPGSGEGGPEVLPRPGDESGGIKAPKANYSGGKPETHNAIYRAFREAGYPDSEWPSLVELLNHENDTYDPTRPTGGPNSDASGIFQFLSTTWDSVGMQYSEDPYIQSVAGMRYIKQRYGTPTAAWNFWQNPNPPGPDPNWPHWYSTGGMVHLARGGKVSGPGTGTSDSIPAMLSDGEFVMRASAVDRLGEGRLHAMNQGGLVRDAMEPMIRGYAPGGLVTPTDPNLMTPDQQRQVILDAFTPSGVDAPAQDQGMLGGGGDFNSSPEAKLSLYPVSGSPQVSVPKWLSKGSAWISENVQPKKWIDWADSKVGGTAQKDGALWKTINTGIAVANPAIGAMDTLNSMRGNRETVGRQTADMFTIPDLVKSTITANDSTASIPDRLVSAAEVAGIAAPGLGKGAVKGIDALQMASLRNKYLTDIKFNLDEISSKKTRTEIKNSIAQLRQAYPTARLDEVYAADFFSDPKVGVPSNFRREDADGIMAVAQKANPMPNMPGQRGTFYDPDYRVYRSSVYDPPAFGNKATYPDGMRQLGVNTAFFNQSAKQRDLTYANAAIGKYLPFAAPRGDRRGTIMAILAHEYGHILDYHMGENLLDADIEEMLRGAFEATLTGPFRPDSLPPFQPGFTGDASKDYPEEFVEFIRTVFPHEYSYKDFPIPGISFKEVTEKMVRTARMGQPGGGPTPRDGVTLALESINRPELLGNSFAEVFLRGNNASMGSKLVYQLLRDVGDSFDRVHQFGTGKPTVLPKILPFNPSRSDDQWDAMMLPGAGAGSARPAMEQNFSRAMGPLKPKPTVPGAGILQLPPDLLQYYSASQVDAGKVTSIAKSMEKTGVTSPLDLDVSVYGGLLRPGAIDPSKIGTTEKTADGPSILAAAQLLGLENIPTRITERALPDAFTGPFTPKAYPLGGVNPARLSKNDTGIPHRNDYNDTVYNARQASASAARRAYIASLPPLPKGSAYRFLELPGDDESYVFSYLGKGGRENPSLKDYDDVVARGLSPFIALGRQGPWPMMKGGPDGVLRVINKQFPRKQPYPIGNYRPGEVAMINAYTKGYSLGPRMMQEAIDNPDSVIPYAANSPVLTEMGAQMNARFGFDPYPIDGNAGFGGLLMDPDTGDDIAAPFKLRQDLGTNKFFPAWKNGGYVSGPGGPKSDSIPAMLSDGEFVINAASTKRIGPDRLMAMNKYADGGLVGTKPIIPPPPSGGSDPDAYKDLSKIMTTPLVPAASGSSDPDAYKDLSAITPANLLGSALTPKGGGGGASAGAAAPKPKDPRATISAAPRSDSYINPALAGAIKGGFNTVGSILSTAASLAAAGATSGASAAIPGGSAAASSLISAGTQMAGDVAVGAANVLSAFLVGTVTPSQTGQGYGAPLLPQQQPSGGMNNFQSIHNGNITTNNLSEYSRLKDRKDAQKAAPFFNRVNQ